MKKDTELARIEDAIREGKSYYRETLVGRGLGRKTISELLPKGDVDSRLIPLWRFSKEDRKRRLAESPFTSLNLTIRRCLKEIEDEIGLVFGRSEFESGSERMTQEVYGPPEAFEPYSGLAWYALEIESLYDNARKHVWNRDAEVGAYYAFQIGKLYSEFYAMKNAGEFLDQAQRIKQRQREAGEASRKVSVEQKRAAYFRQREAGDKRTEAAKNAATELGVSPSTIRNAFENSRLPK